MYSKLHSFYRVLITATDAEYTPLQLVFFNNFEDGPLGKGIALLNLHALAN